MSFDAGSISARAELDLSAFQTALSEALAGLDQLNAAMESVGEARIALDTSAFAEQAATAEADLLTLSEALTTLPEATAALDAATLHEQVQTAQADLDVLSTTLQELPPGEATLDTATLDAHVQAARDLLTDLGAALQEIPEGTAVLDTDTLSASVQEALQEISTVTEALGELPEAEVTLTIETLAEQAAAAEATLTALSEQMTDLPTATVELDTSGLQQQTQQAEQQIAQVSKAVESIPKGKVELDTQPAQQGIGQVGGLFDTLRARISTVPITPRMDINELRAGVTAATAQLGILDNTAARLAGLGLGAAAVGALAKALFDLGAAFDEAADRIAIMTDATGDDLAALQDSFETLFTSLPASMTDVSQAISILNPRLNLTGDALNKVATQVLELSRLTGTSLAGNARAAADAFNVWRVAAEDMPDVLDQVFRVARATGIGVDQLLQSVGTAGPIFQQFGLNLSDSLALLGQLEKAGLDAATVMVGFRQAFAKFTEAGTDPTTGLQNLLRVMRDIPDESEAARLALEAFGPRVAAKLVPAIRDGRLGFEEFSAAIQAGGATIQGVADETDDASQKFQKAINGLIKELKPGAEIMFNFGTTTVNAMNTAGKAIGEFLDGAGKRLLEFRQRQESLNQAAQARREAGLGERGVGTDPTAAVTQAMPALEALEAALERDRLAAEEAAAALVAMGEAGKSAAEQAQEDQPGVEASLNATAAAAFNLQKALADAGVDEAAISSALDYANALKLIEQAINTLDPALATEIVALRNWANSIEDVEQRHRALSEIAQRAQGILRARADAAEAAAQADRLAAAAAEVLNNRYAAIVSGALPALTRQQAELVAQLQAGGQPAAAASAALAALGVSAEAAEAALAGTGQQATDFVEKVGRIAAASDVAGNALKITEQAAGQMLSTLAQGLPASEQAWFQYVAAVEGNAAALRQVYQRLGGDLRAFDQASAQTQQAMIQRLSQQRTAAETLRTTGRLLPAPQEPDVLRQQAQQLQALNRQVARSAEDLAVAQQRHRQDVARQFGEFQQQRFRAEAVLEDAQQSAQAQYQQAVSGIAQARAAAQAEFNRQALQEQETFQRQWARLQRDRAQEDVEAVRAFTEQVAALQVQSIDEARDANDRLIESQVAMLDQIRATFASINKQAADTIKGIHQQLMQTATATANLFSGVFTNLPGQQSPEQKAALEATEARNQAILAANLKIAEQAAKQQEILTAAQDARDALDKAAFDAEKDFQKQSLDLAKQAQQQRTDMVEQLTQLNAAFARQTSQTGQQRTDADIDERLARGQRSAAQDEQLSQAFSEMNRQLYAAYNQRQQALHQAQQQYDATQQQIYQQEQELIRQERRQQEDVERQQRRQREDEERERERLRQEEIRAREFARQGDLLEQIRNRLRGAAIENDFHDNTIVEPASELLERATNRIAELVAEGA